MTVRLTPYFMMKGNAQEAIQFYKIALNAEVIHIQTYGELPMAFPEELKTQIAHALIKVGDTNLMFSDSPGQPIQSGNNLTICITTNDVDQTKAFYEALLIGGKVLGKLEKTPFSPAFGSVIDKFGITFTLVTEV